MDSENLKNNLKDSIEDVELTKDDHSYIMEEAKIAALLYHALVSYGIPGHLAESLTRDYFNSRLGCEEEEDRVAEEKRNQQNVRDEFSRRKFIS